MPRKRLTMRKIREVLRLKAAGLNIREIAESTGSARTTVYEYLVRAEGAGLSWPLPDDMDDEALEARLFPPATAELARRRPVPDWREVHRELRSGKHVTLRLLWLEWKAEPTPTAGATASSAPTTSAGSVARTSSCGSATRLGTGCSSTSAATRYRSPTPARGEVAQAEVFVAVLGCSGMLYVEATAGQELPSWLMAHVHAFEAYGGAPVATTPDNLKLGRHQGLLLRPRNKCQLCRAGPSLQHGHIAHEDLPAP